MSLWEQVYLTLMRFPDDLLLLMLVTLGVLAVIVVLVTASCSSSSLRPNR